MRRLGFLGKQLLAYSLLLVVVVVIMVAAAYRMTLKADWEKSLVVQEQLTTMVVDEVNNHLDTLLIIASQVSNDTQIIQAMAVMNAEDNDPELNGFLEDEALAAQTVRVLERHKALGPSLSAIDILNDKGDYLCTDPTKERLEIGQTFYASEGFRRYMEQEFITKGRQFFPIGPSSLMPPEIAGEQSMCLIMPIRSEDGGTIYGWTHVYLGLKDLYARLDVEQRTNMEIYLFHDEGGNRGHQLYPTEIPLPDPISKDANITEATTQFGYHVLVLQYQNRFMKAYRPLLFTLCGGGLLVFLTLFFCVYMLVRHTSKPLVVLNQQVREATLENLPAYNLPDASMDEIRELEQSFDLLIRRLQASVRLERESHFKALQAQMNPHFLYNCLGTLSSMGVEAHNKEIPRFCTKLASILRYTSTYSDTPTTFANEVENTRNYLSLIETRYEEDFTYTLHIDEDLLDVRVPRLTLQPLIENCFEHGFVNTPMPWHIDIRIQTENTGWTIEVADNGDGITDSRCKELLEQIEKSSEALNEDGPSAEIGGIGLVNAVLRLQLMTQGRITCLLKKNRPKGLRVILKGENYDAGSDR